MIKVELKSGIYTSSYPIFRVKHERGSVLLGADKKIISLTTPTAHKLALSLIRKSREAMRSDFVNLSINGEEMGILPNQANQLGEAILKKAIKADDYQNLENAK